MRFSTICLFLCTARASAWVANPTAKSFVTRFTASTTSSSSSSSAFFATVEENTSTAATTSSKTVLKPDFQAALEVANQKLKASIPEKYQSTLLPPLAHFVQEYIEASQVAYEAGDTEHCTPEKSATRILTGIQYGLQYGVGDDKFQFDVSHTALRGNPETENGNTVDFYKFGCDFFRPCMDLANSPVLGMDNLHQLMGQMEAGENVVLFANHQSEADPQVVSCCLEVAGYAKQAAEMVYVAGHKVTTDALAIPFSMGRNLICIHSKKHINADPDTKAVKQRQNLKAMGALLDKFKAGGCLLWVAPSGGRDRRNVETGEVPLAPFDMKTIDMFRLMGNKSKVKTHYYTLAMVSYELCPPPDFVEAGVGEQRNVRFVPVGIAVGEELESVGGLELRHEFCDHAFAQCAADYGKLQDAIAAQMAK